MPKTYCYALNVDGEKRALQSATVPTPIDAIEIGREMLQLVMTTEKPASAFCTVFAGGGGDEPLGGWIYNAQSRELVWTGQA